MLLWISVGLLCFAACKKEPVIQQVEQQEGPSAPTPLAPGGDLLSQLAAEAAARPANTTTLEQVVAAVGAQGIALGSFQQSIARTHGASYCGNVRSAELYVLVCEYAGPEQLAAGRPLTEVIFKGVPEHSLLTTRRTSVMVQPLTPVGEAQAAKATTILASL